MTRSRIKEVDFSATSDASGMTSELLDDYEEGTWTPTYLSANGISNVTALTTTEGKYVKIGNVVNAFCAFTTTNSSQENVVEGDHIRVGGLPYAGEKIGVKSVSGLVGTSHLYESLGNNANGFGFCQLHSSLDSFTFFVQNVNSTVDTDDTFYANLTYTI